MRPCLEPGCPNPTPRTRCPEHERQRDRERRPTTAYPWAYRQARLRVLERDGHRCHWCGGHATTADHLVPVAHGGSDDDSNLVGSCLRCNAQRGATVRR